MFAVNECQHVDLTVQKKSLCFPKFEFGYIHSKGPQRNRSGPLSVPGSRMICTPPSQTPSVADRVKILTSPFPNDADLKAWAARMIAAADEFQRNKRPDPLGGFVLR